MTDRRLFDAVRRVGDWPPHHATAVLVMLIVFGALAVVGTARVRVDRLTLPAGFAVSVHAELPGIDAATIETTVARPLEQGLAGLTGRRRTESRSRDGEADIRIVFGADTDRDQALASVRARITGSLPRLPPGMSAPAVRLDHSRDPPAAILIVTAPALSDEVEHWAETMLADPLRDLPEVELVAIAGRSRREILIQPDQRRLAGLGLSFGDLIAAAQHGEPTSGRGSVRHNAAAAGGLESVAARAVRLPNGESIALGEVARVTRVDDAPAPSLRLGGEPALRLDVYPRSRAEAFRAAERAHAQLAWLRANALVPKGVAIHTRHDEAHATLVWIGGVLQRVGLCIAVILVAIGLLFGIRVLPRALIAFALWMPAATAALAAGGHALNLSTVEGLTLAVAPFGALLVGRFEIADWRRVAVVAGFAWIAGLVLSADWQTSVAFAWGILAAVVVRWLMVPWLPRGVKFGPEDGAAEPVRRRWPAPRPAANTVAVLSVVAVIVTVYTLSTIGAAAGQFAFRVRGPDPKRLDAILDPLLVSLHVIPRVEPIVASNEEQETWRLRLDPQRLQAVGVGFAEAGRALAIARDGLVVGEVANADRRLALRMRLAPGAAGEAFEHLLLRGESRKQPALYLHDIGVAEKTTEPSELLRIDGEPAVEATALWRGADARDELESFCDRVEVPDGYGEDCTIRVAPN